MTGFYPETFAVFMPKDDEPFVKWLLTDFSFYSFACNRVGEMRDDLFWR
jgi:hypothetical protein